MLKKITLVSDLKKLISKNLMCFRTIDPDLPDGKFEYHYVTKSNDFISFVNGGVDDFETSIFDLISGKYIQMENYPAFFGEVFQVAQLTNPIYSEFFNLIGDKSIVVDYSKPVYFLRDFSLVPDSQFNLYDSNGLLKDGLYSNIPEISNFCENHFSKKIVYLYLGAESGVKCLSASSYNELLLLNEGDVDAVGSEFPATLKALDIFEGEKFFILKSLAISIEGYGVFFTAINDVEALSLPSKFKIEDDIEYQEDNGEVFNDAIEQDVFELDDDIEYEDDDTEIDIMDDEVEFSINDNAVLNEDHDVSVNEHTQDSMDDEVAFSISEIDLIDDIDDDLDLGGSV